jgi:hypothetical protein
VYDWLVESLCRTKAFAQVEQLLREMSSLHMHVRSLGAACSSC